MSQFVHECTEYLYEQQVILRVQLEGRDMRLRTKKKFNYNHFTELTYTAEKTQEIILIK